MPEKPQDDQTARAVREASAAFERFGVAAGNAIKAADKRGILWSPHHPPRRAMPEPDFDQIARSIAVKTAVDKHMDLAEQNARLIAEQLRQVWNARGAADVEAMDAAHSAHVPVPPHLVRAIRTLDR